MSHIHKIAIVGAGFSGTMVAVQLLRQIQQPLTVYLIEPNQAQVGRGVAYSTDQDCHLLNVPACNMSAFPDEPTHFFAWAKARENELLQSQWVTEVTPEAFLPRRIYGDYLIDILNNAEDSAKSNRLIRKVDRVVKITTDSEQATLSLLAGESLSVHKVVLAIGNFPPGDPWVTTPHFYTSGRYVNNPWQSGLLTTILKSESCLLIGSGLTMVDWAVLLKEAGYQGKIHSISRRGLAPQAHHAYPKILPPIQLFNQPNVRKLLHSLRRLIQETACDWRLVIDSLRPISPTIWASLPKIEQQRFLRHLRTYWDCHRHRLAPAIAKKVDDLCNTGQLHQDVGRILAYHETHQGVNVSIKSRGNSQTQTLNVDLVVNCSGSESDYRKLDCPLVKNLLEQGLARPDPLALGLDVSIDGELIDSNGELSNLLFTLGPPQKGVFWETTAVPEIRGQAEKLASLLLSTLPTPKNLAVSSITDTG